jgi:hypothetical protein
MRKLKIGTEKDIIKAVAAKTGYTEEIVADMYKAITIRIDELSWEPTMTRITLGRELGVMYPKVLTLFHLHYANNEVRTNEVKRLEFSRACKEKIATLSARGFVKTSFHYKTPTIESDFLRERKTHEEVAKIQNDIYYKSIESKIN